MTRLIRLTLMSALCLPAITLAPLFGTAPLYAQATDDGEITVIGLSKPYRLKYKHLKKAARKYDEGKAELAPDSELLFEVWPTDPNDDVSDITLELVPKKGEAIAIPINADGRFIMPIVDGNDWKLMANRGKKSIAIKPIVLSPGTNETDRRLGDVRLQCPVLVAVMSSNMSFLEKGAFGAMGGCTSNSIAIFYVTRQPLQSATIIEGERNSALILAKNDEGVETGVSYRPPLSDEAWSNEARITLVYRQPVP